MAFLVDGSSGISLQQFEQQLGLVKYFALYFRMSRRETHMSLIVFGSSPKMQIGFKEYPTSRLFIPAVDRAQRVGGETRLDLALEAAYTKIFNSDGGSRQETPR